MEPAASTYGTTESFLVHFGLESVGDLPGVDELKGAGFLDAMPAAGLDIPAPSEDLAPDEDPRVKLAAWMTDPKNESFSGAMVNRVWKHYLGVGLVEPRPERVEVGIGR